jgi:exodeoxyribonuclease VII small subunit
VHNNAKTAAGNNGESLDHLSYEEGYARLQTVLESLESGELPLEEALKMYEMGTRLAAHCAKKLEDAELRVQRWQDGGQTVPFDGWRADE